MNDKKHHKTRKITKERLEGLYALYNHREFVHPDPLEFLYGYPDPLERELVGLIASSLAYGRVVQILKSVGFVLERMGPSPRAFLMESSPKEIIAVFSGFRHRFTTGEDMAAMLLGARDVIGRYGSLYECFMDCYNEHEETVLPALSMLVGHFDCNLRNQKNSLLPSPHRGSACKRLNLFLRWMVREDRVDPGGWPGIPASKLVVPIDTHMHRICLDLNMTRRKQADMRTAIEITHSFREMAPDDPVRYDFALTRLGIRKDADLEMFLREC